MNMKKIIFGFTLLVVLLTACDNSKDSTPVKATLWEISKDGNTIYLAGSVHLLRPKDYPMPAAFDYAYKKSSVLVLETDVDSMSDPDIEAYMNEKIMLPEGQTLRTVLTEEVYGRLEGLIGTSAMESLSQYKPSVIVNSLQTSYLQQYGKFTKDGADFYYLDKSKHDKKSVGFLEDVKVQIDMLSDMADGIENEYVSDAIDGLPYLVFGTSMLVSEWKEGIATMTEASLTAEKAQWPTIYEVSILNRNSAWLPKIEAYLTTEPIEFIIVGMAHVYGTDGLLHQLGNKGYTIRQLVN